MKSNISKLQVLVFFHLRWLQQHQGLVTVTDEVNKQLVVSLDISRLDYCN